MRVFIPRRRIELVRWSIGININDRYHTSIKLELSINTADVGRIDHVLGRRYNLA